MFKAQDPELANTITDVMMQTTPKKNCVIKNIGELS